MMSWGELMDGCTVVWLARSIEDPSIPKRNLILNTIETIWSRHFGSRKFTILVCRMPNANQPNAFNANTYSRGWPILSTISSWVWSLPGTALMRSHGVQWALGFDSSHFYKFFFKPRADLDCCFLKPAFSPMIFHKIFTNTSIFDGNIHLTAMSRRTSCWACCGNRIRDGDILKRSLEVSRSILFVANTKNVTIGSVWTTQRRNRATSVQMLLMNGALRVKPLLRCGPGDCSRIAQVRAILDAAKLSTRIICDNRVISCMNAVKSVESVLKKVPPDVG